MVSIEKRRGSKALSLLLAGTLAVGMVPGLVAPEKAQAAESASTEGLVTIAAYRAAESAPEILGITGVGTNSAWTGEGALTWGAPVYYLMGTDRNTSPNPYMVNAVAKSEGTNPNASPTSIYSASGRSLCGHVRL